MIILEKFKLGTFAVAFVLCALVWIVIVIVGLFSIGDLGFGGFIALVFLTTIVLAVPLAVLSVVLGLHKIKKVETVNLKEVGAQKPQIADVNSEYEKFKAESSVTLQERKTEETKQVSDLEIRIQAILEENTI